MLFWHVALLFSGLCTSVLATGLDGYPSHSGTSQSSGPIGHDGYHSDTSQSSGAISHDGHHSDTSQSSASGVPQGYEKLQGCWIGSATKNRPHPKNLGQKISIQGRKIVHSTLASQIEKDPRELQDTYWKQGCEGLPVTAVRTTIIKNRIHIKDWVSDKYSVSFYAVNNPEWRPTESLQLGGIFKKNKKSVPAVE